MESLARAKQALPERDGQHRSVERDVVAVLLERDCDLPVGRDLGVRSAQHLDPPDPFLRIRAADREVLLHDDVRNSVGVDVLQARPDGVRGAEAKPDDARLLRAGADDDLDGAALRHDL
jgi:hypothetical protein